MIKFNDYLNNRFQKTQKKVKIFGMAMISLK